MIIDKITNASMYYGLSERLDIAFKFLQETDLESLAAGRHEICGDECYALAMAYETKPAEAGIWEAHKRYMDVQYVVAGEELLGYANIERLEVDTPYDEKGDAILLKGQGSFFLAKPGDFLVFAPQDAHMPGISPSENKKVKKVVVKVLI